MKFLKLMLVSILATSCVHASETAETYFYKNKILDDVFSKDFNKTILDLRAGKYSYAVGNSADFKTLDGISFKIDSCSHPLLSACPGIKA